MEEHMTVHTELESFDVQRPPPSFGQGRSWRLRCFEWYSRDPKDPNGELLNSTVMLPKGMPVHEKLHAAYWEARDVAAKAVEIYRKTGVSSPYPYFLFNKNNEMVGYGAFDEHDDADDMAWISCMFLEMGLKTAFPMSPDVTADERGAPINAVGEQIDAGCDEIRSRD
jgi:hypothetical protein